MEHTLSREIVEKINPQVVFEIPVFGGIPVTETVVVTWFIMIILIVFALIAVRNFKTVPEGMQNVVEIIVDSIYKFLKGIIGEEGKVFAPYIGTIALYLTIANTIAIFGFTPPTKDLNTTAALAIMSIVLVIGAGIKFKGFKSWLGSFKEPVWFMLPLNILELFVKPLSLSMRLFGNILGSFVIMELLFHVVPLGLPAVFSIYFDIFDGLIQMVVFIFLTSLYLKEVIE